MAGEDVCVFDEDSGQETPVGFRDTPGQWYTANYRKRIVPSHLDERSMQRNSQATEPVTPPEKISSMFAVAVPSQKEEKSCQYEGNDVDEEETQIRMTNSDEQEGAPGLERKIFEKAVPLPISTIASRFVGDATMKDGDEDDDSELSDDMLEQDGSAVGLSSIAALFQCNAEKRDALKKRIYKPRASSRSSPVLSASDDSDSGGETEIEREPNEELLAKSQAEDNKVTSSQCRSSVHMAEGASNLKVAVREESLSMPKKTHQSTLLSPRSKRNQNEALAGSNAKGKRSRHVKDEMSLHCLDQTRPLKKRGSKKRSKTSDQDKYAKPPHNDQQIIVATAHDISEDKSSWCDEAEKASSLLASRSRRMTSTSSRGEKRAAIVRSISESESTKSQAKVGSICIILTGLEANAAIRMKIKSIAGAVYESDIKKATHVIAPQNQLKRTVKLLCGISCCMHILGERWLDESARAGVAVDEKANCLRDEEAERKWQFDLRSTMYDVPLEQRQRLFTTYSVFITNHNSVLPPVKDLVKIVECAGGKASSKGKPRPNDVVITSEAALAVATVRKQLANANPDRIFSTELILSSILMQRVELDRHRLKLPTIGKAWATKRRNK